MSQSIRIGSGLSPILQHIPNASSSSSSCMFLSTQHIGFPFSNLSSSSVKECRKRAAEAAGLSMVVSKRNHHPFLPCAASTMKSNVAPVGEEDDTTSNKAKYNDPLLLSVSQLWYRILSHIRSMFPFLVSKEVVVWMILLDRHGPIDGLGVLLDASLKWRSLISLTAVNKLYDPKEFDDHYIKSYLQKARMMDGGTNKDKPNNVKKSPSRTRASVCRLLADLKDPKDGLEVLSGALEFWRMVFSSNELNDSEGYLQKEILAIRDLSRRISVSNRNGKNPCLLTARWLELYKLKIDYFEDPEEAVKARREAIRCYFEGVECDGVLGLMVVAIANYCRSKVELDVYLSQDILAIPDSSEEDPRDV